MESTLSILGASVRIKSSDELHSVHEQLQEDFKAFETVSPLAVDFPEFEIELRQRCVDEPPAHLKKVFRFRTATAYGKGPRRFVRYPDGSALEINNPKATISAPTKERLWELSYLWLQSALGEVLDSFKFHRIHALGVESEGRAALLIMDSGVGKTSIAEKIAKTQRSITFYSDEIPLVSENKLYPNPIRLSFKEEKPNSRRFMRTGYGPRYLLNFDHLGVVAKPKPIEKIIICTRNLDAIYVRPASKFELFFALLKSMVVGVGTPQMTEFLVKFDFKNFFTLAAILLDRYRQAVMLTLKTSAVRVDIGSNLNDAAKQLVEILESKKSEAK